MFLFRRKPTKIMKKIPNTHVFSNNLKTLAAKKIQKHAQNYLSRKSAFMYTHGYNKAIRGLIGNYPQTENVEYNRAAVFRRQLLKSMKPVNLRNSNLSRGVSGANANVIRKHIANGTPYNRNAFSSFTRNLNVAKRFTNQNKLVLKLVDTKVPAINYTNKTRGIRSLYAEKEVLLPPGRFIIQNPPTMNGNFKIYKVHFIPKVIKNINKNTRNLRSMGEKKYPNVLPLNDDNNSTNMNIEWKKRRQNATFHILALKRLLGKSGPPVPQHVIDMLETKFYNNFGGWNRVILRFISIFRKINRPGAVLSQYITTIKKDKNKLLISKKFAYQIITYAWNTLSKQQQDDFISVLDRST